MVAPGIDQRPSHSLAIWIYYGVINAKLRICRCVGRVNCIPSFSGGTMRSSVA